MKDYGSGLVAGRLPALACLHAGKRKVYKAFVYRNGTGLEEIVALLNPEVIAWCDKKELDSLSQGTLHQGVILHADPVPLLTAKEFLALQINSNTAVFVLDGITDPMNFGAIIRSAAAFGAAGVLFQKDRAAPVTPAVIKASAGGIEYINLIQATNLVRDLQQLKQGGYWITALDANAPKTIWQADLKGQVALVIGSEGDGIRRLVKEQCDFTVSIPVRAELASLNASVSAGIALGEWVRQNNSVI